MSYVAEDTRQKLIEAAREQFYKKGINDTTLEKITKQAFVQPSAVSYYFGGKRGLIENVIDGFYNRIYEKVETISDNEEIKPILWIYVLWNNIAFDSNIARCMTEYLSMDVSDPNGEPTMRFSEFVEKTRYTFDMHEGDEGTLLNPYYCFCVNNHALYGMMKYALKTGGDRNDTVKLLARTDVHIKAMIAGVRDLDIVKEKCEEAEEILAKSEVKDLRVMF
ncbi:MAG: TetR/AcrR family transcriptional regulator [Eubacteriaceae bacterium]|nr:TetR/AcrR family transcriptional regulator [Eubacteriaceae bacterium]